MDGGERMMQKAKRKAYSKPLATRVKTAEAINGLAMACCAILGPPT